jgi:hypothetical protein
MILTSKIRDKAQLESYKKNALTLTFKGTRTAPASKVEWEEYLLHLVPLVIEHPKIFKYMHHIPFVEDSHIR